MKDIVVEANNFDIDSFIDKILKFLKTTNKWLDDDIDAPRPHIFNPDETDFWEEPVNYLKKGKKDYLLQLKKGETLFIPYTSTPFGDEIDNLSYLESADGTEYNAPYLQSSAGPAAFQWGDDNEDEDTFLDFAEHIGFTISLKNSKYIIESGILKTGGRFFRIY